MPKSSFGFTLISGASKGFTLIELLIVISIIAILSTIGYVEYKTFSASQILGSSVNEVQSLIRTAQNNATTSFKLNNHACKNWIVKFNTNGLEGYGTVGNDISLVCQPSDTSLPDIVKTPNLKLPTNVQISVSKGSPCPDTTSFPTYSASAVFSNLYGKPSFIMARSVPNVECFSNSDMTITLTYTPTGVTKNIIVSKGGGIDVR